MTKSRTFALSIFAVAIVILASCAVKPHPNEKILVGTWKALKVEKVVDSSALQAAMGAKTDTTKIKNTQNPKKDRPVTPGATGKTNRKEMTYDRIVQNEMRSTLEIYANKTAVKKYPKKTINATWKLKGRGTRLVAKNKENKMKFVIEILEIQPEQIVVVEHLPVGDVKVVYGRQQ